MCPGYSMGFVEIDIFFWPVRIRHLRQSKSKGVLSDWNIWFLQAHNIHMIERNKLDLLIMACCFIIKYGAMRFPSKTLEMFDYVSLGISIPSMSMN